MSPRLTRRCSIVSLLLLGWMPMDLARAASGADAELVQRALAAELAELQDVQHPMIYRLRKASPRLATTKRICETKDGAVARLIAVNDQPLSAADEQKEQARLDALLADPSKQRHRKQSEDEDTKRVIQLVRALPNAFVYTYEGIGEGPHGKVEKFAFKPNPHFEPPDIETHALSGMTGEIWIDAVQDRVVKLEGHLSDDVDIGWGLLGRLNKGGWIVIEQADVADHQWRMVHFQLAMVGRVLLKTKSFDTQEDVSDFAKVPATISYSEAIRLLRSNAAISASTR